MAFQTVLQTVNFGAFHTPPVSQNLQPTPTLASVTTLSTGSWIRDAIPDGPPPTSPNQVAWQTAFWALAAIAVNTCLQESGRVCEIPKEFALFVRSSPVYCLLDSLVVIFQICKYSVTQGPRRATQIVSSCREQHSLDSSENNYKLALYITRGLLMVMATLQVIKLFAMQGILWSQLFGACFLLSFVVNGIINVFGKAPIDLDEETQPLPRRGDIRPSVYSIHWISILAYTLQVVVWTVALEPVVPDRLKSLPGGATDICLWPLHLLSLLATFPFLFTWVVIFTLAPSIIDIGISMIPVGLRRLLLWTKPIKKIPSLGSMLCSIFGASEDTIAIISGIIIFTGFGMLRVCKLPYFVSVAAVNGKGFNTMSTWTLDVAFKKMDPYLVTLTLIVLVLLLSYSFARIFMFGGLAKPLRLEQHMFASNLAWACLFLFSADVVCALLYYSKAYNLEGTNQPKWIGSLPRALR